MMKKIESKVSLDFPFKEKDSNSLLDQQHQPQLHSNKEYLQ